jgi:hypothetical protein
MKGVSPVVAIILIVAISVLASVSVWYWTNPLMSKPSTIEKSQKTITIEECYPGDTLTSRLLIRNSGGLQFSAQFDVYLKTTGNKHCSSTGATYNGTYNVLNLDPGRTSVIYATGDCDLDAGTTYILRGEGMPDAEITC